MNDATIPSLRKATSYIPSRSSTSCKVRIPLLWTVLPMFIKLEKRPECPMGQVLLTRGSAGGCPLHVHIDQALLSGIHSPYNLQLSSPCHSSPAPSRSLSLRPPLKLDCSPRNGQQYLVTKRPADVAPTFITSFNRTTRHSLYLPSFFLLPSSFFLPTHHVLHSKLLQSLSDSLR